MPAGHRREAYVKSVSGAAAAAPGGAAEDAAAEATDAFDAQIQPLSSPIGRHGRGGALRRRPSISDLQDVVRSGGSGGGSPGGGRDNMGTGTSTHSGAQSGARTSAHSDTKSCHTAAESNSNAFDLIKSPVGSSILCGRSQSDAEPISPVSPTLRLQLTVPSDVALPDQSLAWRRKGKRPSIQELTGSCASPPPPAKSPLL